MVTAMAAMIASSDPIRCGKVSAERVRVSAPHMTGELGFIAFMHRRFQAERILVLLCETISVSTMKKQLERYTR